MEEDRSSRGLTTFFTRLNKPSPSLVITLQSSALYPGPLTTTLSMTMMSFAFHLALNCLSSASNTSCVSRPTALLIFAARSFAFARAALARDCRAAVLIGVRGARDWLFVEGRERMVKDVRAEKGIMW